MAKKIYFIISFVLDVILILFMLFLCEEEIITTKGDYLMAVPIIIILILYSIISMKAFVTSIREPEKKQVCNIILMKITLFFTILAFSFLGYEDGIYAFGLFLFTGFIFAAITIFVIKYKLRPDASVREKPNIIKEKYEFIYKGKRLWDSVASEYMRINGITDVTLLTEEDNDKIYDYAAGPFAYFFYYMAIEGFFSETFYESIYERLGNEYLYELEKRNITPIDVLRDLDYHFEQSDIAEGFLPFFRKYYDDRGRFWNTECYVYDYCDAIDCLGDAYYCIDFSWELADKIVEVIRKRYEDYNKTLYRFDRIDFYDEDEKAEGITTSFICEKFNCYVDVRRTGPIYTGNITAEYVDRCIESLEKLSNIQLDRFLRWLGGIYGDIETGKDVKGLFRDEDDLTLYVMDPKEEGDVVYSVAGGCELDPEHGVSFSVRNGRIVVFGYAYDFEDLYTDENIQKYNELVEEIDYTSIKTKADMDRLEAEGKLVRVPVKPKLDECIYMKPSKHKYIKISDELVEAEYMYLPPLCAKKLEDTEHKLRRAFKFVKANGVTPEICYSLGFCEDKEHNIISMVPNRIIIRDLNDSSWSKFVFDVYVWE